MQHLNFMGWILVLLLLYLVTKTKAGYKAVYGSVFLILLYLFLRNYKVIEEKITD